MLFSKHFKDLIERFIDANCYV